MKIAKKTWVPFLKTVVYFEGFAYALTFKKKRISSRSQLYAIYSRGGSLNFIPGFQNVNVLIFFGKRT